MDTELYEEAVRDYEKVYQTEKTSGVLLPYFLYFYQSYTSYIRLHLPPPEHKQLLKNAQMELKKSKRKDYYKVLGVGKNATEDEIKKAYRKRALMHHPGTDGDAFL